MTQTELLQHLVNVLERQNLRYGITGSHGTMAFGEPRFTMDIDVVVELSPSTLDAFCAEFPYPQFYTSQEGARHAANHGGMFNIIDNDSGQKIDVVVPRPDQLHELDRAVRAPALAGLTASFISPEDLILNKMKFYREGGSEKHLRDIRGILKMIPSIDRTYIAERAEGPELADIWDSILKEL